MAQTDGTSFTRVWQVPAYLPYLQPVLTDDAIAQAQEALGVVLPESYLDLLRAQNGGYVRFSNHPNGEAPVDRVFGIGPNYPSILETDWTEVKEEMDEEGLETPERIDDLFPFCGDGHYFFCLDYRESGRNGEPCVSYINVELFDTDVVVAPDFATFLGGLRSDIDNPTFGLISAEPIDDVAKGISTLLGVQFKDMGDQDYGYPVRRAPLSDSHVWAWLSPNRVRRGFVRRDHAQYESLANLLPGEADRIPEYPDCSHILSTNAEEPVAEDLLRKLQALPFEIKRIAA